MRHSEVFFPTRPPDEAALGRSRRFVIAEGAVAAVIYSLGTGNFLAGYLTFLGASVAVTAAISMIPQLGCVLQFSSPFLFERVHHRKLAVFLLCVVFRFSLSLMYLMPLFTGQREGSVPAVILLYCLAFFAAGIVTPGLSHLVLNLAPGFRRGRFFAVKEIVGTMVNGVATLLLGRGLDFFIRQGEDYQGFVLIGSVSLGLALLDALLLLDIREKPVEYVSHLRVKDIAMPVKDERYRPLLLYYVLGGFFSGISSSFLYVYELRVLGLSHTFITTVGILSAGAAIAGGWIWGWYADRTSWTQLFKKTALLSLLCTCAWAFVRPSFSQAAAGIMIGTAFAAGGQNIASQNLQFFFSPERGKTTYFGVTSALSSLAACLSAVMATSAEPYLERIFGEETIAVFFLLSGTAGLGNYFWNSRKIARN